MSFTLQAQNTHRSTTADLQLSSAAIRQLQAAATDAAALGQQLASVRAELAASQAALAAAQSSMGEQGAHAGQLQKMLKELQVGHPLNRGTTCCETVHVPQKQAVHDCLPHAVPVG